MSLKEEIDKRSAEIKTDSYSMSIGELISLYEQDEIEIHPEFQRFFRWTETQKSKLIESILLGIPLPPIFVSQRQDGVWDVVDGLQRISTILELVGILTGPEGEKKDPLVLEPTRYLPSLDGKVWSDESDNSFSSEQRLYVKRARLDVNIVQKESDPRSKYDLFERLNTGGTPLSDQEVRNCLMIMLNPERFEWFSSLRDDDNFRHAVALSDRNLVEQYDLELILRFILFRSNPSDAFSKIEDLSEFLTDQMIEMTESESFDQDLEERIFRETFAKISDSLGGDAFRRYSIEKQKFLGGFLVSAFESVALGLGYNLEKSQEPPEDKLPELVKEIWEKEPFKPGAGAGRRASSRLGRTIPLGRKHFKRANGKSS